MKRLTLALLLALASFPLFPAARADDEPPGLIEVRVTGLLNTSATLTEGRNGWVFAATVRAGGRDLSLDCTANEAARKLIEEAHGKPGEPRSWIVLKKVQVEGRLRFLPYELFDAKGTRIEHRDMLPVIVVRSLKIAP